MKLTNAPNMKKQDSTGNTEITICIGAQAWDFAKQYQEQGRGAAEVALSDILNDGGNSPCVVVTDEMLSNINGYRIAPPKARFIRLQRANGGQTLNQEAFTLLCSNLAKLTKAQSVNLYDEGGSLLENLSGYIERLRNDDSVVEILNKSTRTATNDKKAGNLSPYIEQRTEGGKEGLFRITPKLDKDTGEMIEKTEWLCDPVEVVGMGKSDEEYFSMLSFYPFGATKKTLLALPLKDIGERTGWQLLRKNGLTVTNNTRLKIELADYLQDCRHKTQWHITTVTGWQNGAYILPNGEIIGQATPPVFFSGQSANQRGYGVRGSVEDWQREIADNLKGNYSMMLGVACALSAPLIGRVEAESFGVHLFGGSSSGKTTTANIASSIYGHPDEIRLSWFSTPLALANEAQARNDGFMPLDEIGQGANKKHVADTAYTLFNGVGKMQGHKNGGNRDIARWRTLAFSTGETDLESYLLTAGLKTNVGQLVRLLNIPIHRAEHFHQHGDGKAHVDHLNRASRLYFGAIGREWIMYLTKHQAKAKDCYHKTLKKWLERLPDEASAQVKRVANRFALLETALILSQHLTKWSADDSKEAMIKIFNTWVNEFGLHSREEKQVIEQVNGFLLRNGARFIEYPFNPSQSEPRDTAGYRLLGNAEKDTKEKFYVFPQVYIEDVITGFNERQANEILHNVGMLESSDEKAYKYRKRVPKRITGGKTTRCYVLAILDEAQEDEETEEK